MDLGEYRREEGSDRSTKVIVVGLIHRPIELRIICPINNKMAI